MYDLNVKWKPSKVKENCDMTKQLLKLGWSSTAWNNQNFGKLGAKSQKQSTIVSLDTTETKECTRFRGITNTDNKSAELEQHSRITIIIDDVVDAQVLTAGNEILRSYDIVAACPGNAAVFAYLCKTAQVDIISIDFSRRVTFSLIKKQLDQAIERGIVFEILYSPLLYAPGARRDVIAGTRVLVQFLRGRNIILSSGAETANDVRGPFDVVNMGQMLGLSAEQAKLAITKNCESVLKHAKARRLKFLPVEVFPTVQDAKNKWLKKEHNTTKSKISSSVREDTDSHVPEREQEEEESSRKRQKTSLSHHTSSSSKGAGSSAERDMMTGEGRGGAATALSKESNQAAVEDEEGENNSDNDHSGGSVSDDAAVMKEDSDIEDDGNIRF